MSKFIIEGGQPLHGEITASGNKNAALKLLPACLLTDEPVVLHNIPAIRDVENTILGRDDACGYRIDELIEEHGVRYGICPACATGFCEDQNQFNVRRESHFNAAEFSKPR